MKLGGMGVSGAQRLQVLEDENGLLKRQLADAMLDKAASNELLTKNGRVRGDVRKRRSSASGACDKRAEGETS